MTHHAHCAFTVNIQPLTPPPAEGLDRFSIDKQIHGALEATTKGEMFSGGDPKQGGAGYVAIEVVTGSLERVAVSPCSIRPPWIAPASKCL